MQYNIKNNVALVTGANRGIGRAIVEELLARGAAKVYAAVRDRSSASELAQKYGNRVVPVEVDLTRPETIEAAARVARDVTLVVNNAGVLKSNALLSEGTLDSLAFEMDVNVYGLIRVAQAFAPIVKANGGGAFVQLNSIVSLRSFPGIATYAASKAASYSITQALRSLLREDGIQVVSVHPGPIATDMARDGGFDERAEPATVVASAIADALNAGRFHVFPDSIARQLGGEYENFAANIIETELAVA